MGPAEREALAQKERLSGVEGTIVRCVCGCGCVRRVIINERVCVTWDGEEMIDHFFTVR